MQMYEKFYDEGWTSQYSYETGNREEIRTRLFGKKLQKENIQGKSVYSDYYAMEDEFY
jgi:hypothetical protein